MTAFALTKEVPDRGGMGNEAFLQDIDAGMVAGAVAMEFPNDGNVIVVLKSVAAGAITATLKAFPDQSGRGGGGTNDVVYVIPIGSTTPQICIIPFADPTMFNSGGNAQITLSAATDITVSFIRIYKVR